MNKLLRANFLHLRKNRYFWLGIVIMIFYSITYSFGQYRNMKRYDTDVPLEVVFFGSHVMIGVLIAAFCSMFTGTEYSDGTIRNKLIVGCCRRDIYITNFITCTVAGVLMNFAYMFTSSLIGIPLFGLFDMKWYEVIVYMLNGVLMTAALASIFSMLSMLNQNKSLVAIISVVSMFGLIFLTIYITMKLGAPEFMEGVSNVITNGDTITQTIEMIPNPNYLTPSQRNVYEFIFNFLPTGQGVQISNVEIGSPLEIGIYSVIITVIMNIIGIAGFRRKDLK